MRRRLGTRAPRLIGVLAGFCLATTVAQPVGASPRGR